MDRLGNYRGHEVSVTLHSNGKHKLTEWHSSIYIQPVCTPLAHRHFTVEPSLGTVSEARERAIRIARFVIDGFPGAPPVVDTDL